MNQFDYDFEQTVDEFDKIAERNEMLDKEKSLRAEIGMCDRKIASLKDFLEDDTGTAQISAEVENLTALLGQLQSETMKIEGKTSKFGCFLDKFKEDTTKCFDRLTTVEKLMEDAGGDKSTREMRKKELQQAIKARKQMIKETGYDSRDGNYLEEQFKMAQSQLTELQAQKVKIDRLKDLLKTEHSLNGDLKMKQWLNQPLQSKEVSHLSKKRSSRK